jgi:hypothetical protein
MYVSSFYYVCFLLQLYLCPQTSIYVCPHATVYGTALLCDAGGQVSAAHTAVGVLCPHTSISMFSCYYICVLILVYVSAY